MNKPIELESMLVLMEDWLAKQDVMDVTKQVYRGSLIELFKKGIHPAHEDYHALFAETKLEDKS